MKKIIVLTGLILSVLSCHVFSEYKELTTLKSESFRWAKDFGYELMNVKDTKSIGKYGKMIYGLKSMEGIDVDELTVKNLSFWTALIEAGNSPNVIGLHGLLLASQGEVMKADPIFFISELSLNRKEKEYFLGEYRKVQSALSDRVAEEMKAGLALHDGGDYLKALSAYDAVLKGYPQSAWTWYEKGFTYLMLRQKDKSYDKNAVDAYARTRALAPCYYMAYQGSDKAVLKKLQIYLTKVNPVVEQGKNTLEDITGMAYGFEEMGLHAYAAYAFWKLAYYHKGDESLNMFAHFFYNAEKAGCAEIRGIMSEKIKAKVKAISEGETGGNG